MILSTLGLAVVVGFLPAFVWLTLLLQEDSQHPEPRRLIALAFLAGMLAVALALPLEQFAQKHLFSLTSVIYSWAVIEETLKYAFAAAIILWRCSVDEPIDFVIYMVSVGLGFAALENILFLLAPFAGGEVASGILTGSLRFLGSTILHILGSAVVGFSLAFAFKRPKSVRIMAAALGLILASALHALFNLLIIAKDGSETVIAFFSVWTGFVVILALFEVLRYQNRRLLRNAR